MARNPKHNQEVYIELKNKYPKELTKDDMREALNLVRSTQRLEHKVFYTSIKHQVRLNEESNEKQDDNQNEE